ncbi:MAG: hypothetical protein ACYCYM_01465 [Saccharofermentanales bacterium]
MMNAGSWNKRSLCFWSWNSTIEIPELLEQLGQFADNHLGGVVIHARAGLGIPYMGDQWFAAMSAVLEEAQRLALDVFLYDEDGWPSGFAGGKVPEAGEAFCYKTLHYGKGPHGDRGIRAIAAYHCEGGDRYTRVEIGQAEADDLVFWYEPETHYTDLLNPAAVDLFIRSTHDVYREKVGQYFGSVIKGIFTDEPQLNCAGYSWNHEMPRWYDEEYGQELLDNLWLLAVDGEGFRSFRRSWWQLIGKKFESTYVSAISLWCQKNNIAMTGHYACEDSLIDQIASCGGVMQHYEKMQLPGIDHLGNRTTSPVLLKQVSSVSNQLGNGEVLSETFGCTGWSLSFSRLAWLWGRQSVMGITKPCFHLSAYTMEGRRKRDYPAFFSYQELWWDDFRCFSDWMDRHNELMLEGRRICGTLVISPLIDAMGIYRANPECRAEIGHISNQYRLLLENLLDLQMDFEIGDELLLSRHAAAVDGTIRIGRCAYSRVIIPAADTLLDTTWALIGEFAGQGGQVIAINKRPAGLPSSFSEGSIPVVQNRRDLIGKYLQFSAYEREVCLLEPSYRTIAKDLYLHIRDVGKGLRIHVWNASWDKSQRAVLSVKGNVQVRRLLADNTWEWLCSIYDGAGTTSTELDIAAGANILLEAWRGMTEQGTRNTRIMEKQINHPDILLQAPNCLTIDYASYSFEGEDWSEEIPVIQLSDLLYQNRKSSADNQPVSIRYRFTCGLEDPADLTAAIEDRTVEDIAVNGVSIIGRRRNWWMDKSVGEYEIGGYTHAGGNEVIVTYKLPVLTNKVDIHEAFETERNRFCYPVEPENIYIRGSFDVKAHGSICNHGNYLAVADPQFTLVPPAAKRFGDLTPQGLWFYRGDVEYTFSVYAPADGNRLLLSVSQRGGGLIQWRVNSGEGYLFQLPTRTDITDWLLPGSNQVHLRLVGTNRNALGPHHHIHGENIFVGPSTFKGELGFEDFVSPSLKSRSTWTDRYAFIPFGIDKIDIIELESINSCMETLESINS